MDWPPRHNFWNELFVWKTKLKGEKAFVLETARSNIQYWVSDIEKVNYSPNYYFSPELFETSAVCFWGPASSCNSIKLCLHHTERAIISISSSCSLEVPRIEPETLYSTRSFCRWSPSQELFRPNTFNQWTFLCHLKLLWWTAWF